MLEPWICTVCQHTIGNFVGKLFEGVLPTISNQITLVRKCDNNFENLKRQVDNLKVKKKTAEDNVDTFHRRGEETGQELQIWLNSAHNLIETAEKFLAYAEESAKRKCFFRLCLNLKSRYHLSKKAEENSKALVDHVHEARGLNLAPSHIPAPQQEVAAPVKGFEDFNSRSDVLEKIMEALQITSVNVVGVHGMAGVGKTMLVREVKRKAEQDMLFDAVAMAYVTRNADLKEIQTEIAYGLGLDQLPINEITTSGAAGCIEARLKKMKKVLIILDDIWGTGLELKKLGIPLKNEKMTNEGSSSKEEYTECKILLASRVLNVLLDMGAQKVVEVGPLQSDESWKLFTKIVGERETSCQNQMQDIASEIVQECGGLPLAITTIAKGLKNKPSFVWRNALKKLRKPSSENFNSISADVYRAIEISYSHLENDKLKRTFLLCSLMGKNALIEDLLKYGVGLGLFTNTIGEARDEALTLIEELKNSSLIDGYDNRHFHMNNVIHDVAISIALRDRRGLLVTDNCVPKEWEDMRAIARFKWIFLRYMPADGPADGPGDKLKRPQLFFYMAGGDYSQKILANFLNRMHRLQVLYLTKMHFTSLPFSIGLLKNLHTLCFDQSMLGDISVIGNLINLKILSLLNSDLEELPREIGQLTRLKLLDLRNCTKLKVILPSVLEHLSTLEELYMGNSFDQWEDEEHQNHASLSELKQLNKLTALEVCIRDVQIIPGDLFLKKLERCKIFIGDAWNNGWDISSESSRIVKLQLKESSSFGCSVVKRLLEMAEELHLQDLNGVKNVVDDSNNESFQDLKHLFVRNASEVKQIINSSAEGVSLNAFPNLEELFLDNLINLEKIFQGQFKETAFRKLAVLTIEYCDQMKNLFSLSIARQLLQLQEIRVTNCSNLEGIVDDDEQGSGNNIVEVESEFGKLLRSLTLKHLPGLVSFNGCRHMQLFNEQVGFLKLEELQLSWINVDRIWHISITSSCVEKLTQLIIEGCDNLDYLFSSSMAKGLVMLEHLEIRECKKMKEVIYTENLDEMENLRFPQLNFLMIKDLQSIISFCLGNYVLEFKSLKQCRLLNCPNMQAMIWRNVAGETQMLFNEQVDSPNLECLRLSSLNIQQIWHNPLPESSVQNLKRLFVEDCNNLKYLITSSIVKRFSQLIQLEIRDCKMMEEVILTKKLVEEERMCKIFFPRLDSIILQDLPKLSRFSSGSYLQLPSLWQLMISNCPMLKAFISNSSSQDMAATSETGENSCTHLFNSKVAFPKLERLAIFMIGLNKIWDEQLNADSFCQLTTVSVASCEKLVNIFPFNMLGMLQRLDKLELWNCESLEEILESQGPGVSQSLSQTTTQSTAMESTKRFIFSKLTHVDLRGLPKLKSFLPQMHISEWPSLKKLWVYGCGQVQIFASQFSSIQITEGDVQHGIQSKYPLFWISKDSFPSLEELKLGKNDIIKEIWHGQYPGDYFPQLQVLEIINFKEQSALFPSFFFQLLPNLEKLAVSESSFHEIFQCEQLSVEEKPAVASSRLNELKLSKLYELRHLWKEEFDPEPVFCNLRTLEVLECGRLNNLVPSIVSFKSLQSLEVSTCHGVINLVQYSTAKSLVQLRKMSITKCDLVEEIVACFEDDVNDGIVFTKLKYLQLCGLPRLASFCSVKCDFNFPSLEEVIVEGCPRMKIVSAGEVRTSKLERVQFSEDKGLWENDLNTTIQRFFTEKISQEEKQTSEPQNISKLTNQPQGRTFQISQEEKQTPEPQDISKLTSQPQGRTFEISQEEKQTPKPQNISKLTRHPQGKTFEIYPEEKQTPEPQNISKLTSQPQGRTFEISQEEKETAEPQSISKLTSQPLGRTFEIYLEEKQTPKPQNISKLTSQPQGRTFKISQEEKETAEPQSISKLTSQPLGRTFEISQEEKETAEPQSISKLTSQPLGRTFEIYPEEKQTPEPQNISKLTSQPQGRTFEISQEEKETAEPQSISKLTSQPLGRTFEIYSEEKQTPKPPNISKLTSQPQGRTFEISQEEKETAEPQSISKLTSQLLGRTFEISQEEELTPEPQNISKLTSNSDVQISQEEKLTPEPQKISKLTSQPEGEIFEDYVPEDLGSISSFESPQSPEASYNNLQLGGEDFAKEPPMVPPHLQTTPLNLPASNMEILPSSRPQHVVLNHLYIHRERSGPSVVALGSTHRFKAKYVTVVLYKSLRK